MHKKITALVLVAALLMTLIAALPTAAGAATGMATIDISTLGGANADNSGAVATESQWTYDAATTTLTLPTASGNYTLIGSNSGLTVATSHPAIANITFGSGGTGVSFKHLAIHDDCTVTLVGSSTITNSTTLGTAAINVAGGSTTLTVVGDGSLTARTTGAADSSAVLFVHGANLAVSGNATVNAVGDVYAYTGIYAMNNNTISVGANAQLDATGSAAGIHNGNGTLTLDVDGELYATGTQSGLSPKGCGIEVDGTLRLEGSGYISVRGPGDGPAFYLQDNNNPILFGDDITLHVDQHTGGSEGHWFQADATSTWQWKLTPTATTTDPLTQQKIVVQFTGETGTIQREAPAAPAEPSLDVVLSDMLVKFLYSQIGTTKDVTIPSLLDGTTELLDWDWEIVDNTNPAVAVLTADYGVGPGGANDPIVVKALSPGTTVITVKVMEFGYIPGTQETGLTGRYGLAEITVVVDGPGGNNGGNNGNNGNGTKPMPPTGDALSLLAPLALLAGSLATLTLASDWKKRH